jgi:hypothetical protein
MQAVATKVDDKYKKLKKQNDFSSAGACAPLEFGFVLADQLPKHFLLYQAPQL